MKLIIVLGMVDHQKKLSKMFKDANIPIFSKIDVEGFKSAQKQVDMSNWFGGDENSDMSTMFFAFVPKNNAEQIIKQVQGFNQNEDVISPLHAFQLPVEKFV